MSDANPKGGEPNKTNEEEIKSYISLTDASKSGFNARAWNDPPPVLLNTAAVAALQANRETPPRPKLAGRVAYPINALTPAPSMVLNPNAPPPTMGFVNTAGSSSKAASPPNRGSPPPPSS